jgi:acetoin utilization deacetylase AcuC-like enzyme
MKIFYSESHQAHYPPFEILDGGEKSQSFEIPDRVEQILYSLGKTKWAEIYPPVDFGLDPILAIHDQAYVDFLRTAFDLWTAEEPNYEHSALTPATFPPGGLRRIPKSVLGKAGYYMMDLSAPIGMRTYQAALQAVNCSLSGAQDLKSGSKAVFALCRPPGHHAGKANCGGYCYLNNASIAANWLSQFGNVALLDIDYHAGNGTQDIFYERKDVFSLSIHANPEYEYPYYAGYLDETGRGEGSGFHKNFPLSFGTDDDQYINTLEKALVLIHNFKPAYLVLSTGMDIALGDPLGKFKITQDGIRRIGKNIAALKIPTLAVMEGGYNLVDLGENVVTLLSEFQPN